MFDAMLLDELPPAPVDPLAVEPVEPDAPLDEPVDPEPVEPLVEEPVDELPDIALVSSVPVTSTC